CLINRDVHLDRAAVPVEDARATAHVPERDCPFDPNSVRPGDDDDLDPGLREPPSQVLHRGPRRQPALRIVAQCRDDWIAVRRDRRDLEWHRAPLSRCLLLTILSPSSYPRLPEVHTPATSRRTIHG